MAVTPRRDQRLLLERLTHQDSLYGLLSLCHHTIRRWTYFPSPLPPFHPGGTRPIALTEKREPVSPHPTPPLRLTRPFLGLRDKCGGCVRECVCMCPCLRRTGGGKRKSRTTPRGAARSPAAIHPGLNGSYSQSLLRLVHV